MPISLDLWKRNIRATLKFMSVAQHPQAHRSEVIRGKQSVQAEFAQIFQELGELGKALILERARKQAMKAGLPQPECVDMHRSASRNEETQKVATAEKNQAAQADVTQSASRLTQAAPSPKRKESDWAMAPLYERLERKIQRFEARFAPKQTATVRVERTAKSNIDRVPRQDEYREADVIVATCTSPSALNYTVEESADHAEMPTIDAPSLGNESKQRVEDSPTSIEVDLATDQTTSQIDVAAPNVDVVADSQSTESTINPSVETDATENNSKPTEEKTPTKVTPAKDQSGVDQSSSETDAAESNSNFTEEKTPTEAAPTKAPSGVDQNPYVKSWRSIKRFFRRMTDMDLILFTSSGEMFRVFMAMLRALTPFYQGPSVSMDELMKMGTVPG